MKKRFTLLTILIGISCLYTYSQKLTNTAWTVYFPNKTFLAYFYFGTDTLSFSQDNISYTKISTFKESENNFSIVDLPTKTNPGIDTGNYTFLIKNDTLKFTTISDLTTSREMTFATCYWVRLQTGLKMVDLTTSIKFYPNPFSTSTTLQIDKQFKTASLTVYNSVGIEVKQINNISAQAITLNRDNLSSGVYFIRLTLDNKVEKVEKLIIKDER